MASNPFSPLDPGNSRGPFAGPSTAAGSSSKASDGQAKKKKHRGGRKNRRPRRKSFAAAMAEDTDQTAERPDKGPSDGRNGFYMKGRNLSNTSLESEALLDHRDHQYSARPRRGSILSSSFSLAPKNERDGLQRRVTGNMSDHDEEDEDVNPDMGEGAPLLGSSILRDRGSPRGYGGLTEPQARLNRRGSSRSSRRLLNPFTPTAEKHNVNYPPSIPGSPRMDASDHSHVNFGDAMMREEFTAKADLSRRNSMVEGEPSSMLHPHSPFDRRHTIALQAQEDVCFPQEGMSEMADDELQRTQDQQSYRRSRRRRNKWPELGLLEEWSTIERAERSEEQRVKKITEPQLINGRLRPVHKGWYRSDDDVPYRFTYFNETLESTIHSQTISELVQPGSSFRDLFVPEPPLLSDSDDSEEEPPAPLAPFQLSSSLKGSESKASTRQPSVAVPTPISENPERMFDGTLSPTQQPPTNSSGSAQPSRQHSGEATPIGVKSPSPLGKISSQIASKPVRYGERPIWWLNVTSPTQEEMKVLSRTFSIHPLTSEDIMMQEQREKVELFRHYYFISYRSFDQDSDSATHLDPVNMYVVVFREGVISFHFQPLPHPANVRRRIRQLQDYMVLSADWIGYAIIDDITDVFVPLIQNIEDEVDDIDDQILKLHRTTDASSKSSAKGGDSKDNEKNSDKSISGETVVESDSDMLQRVGECRKKVMSLYRLLGNKADVIKGFAKRCNEHWEVAPRSEIGLYLGDIQDHIITMNGNLGHYEMILSRAHGNYLAQINIRMNERSEQTADTLGKLTVLGTIVLPMNIITGLWGMNVWVPGQEHEGNLVWFWTITAGLLCFGVGCYLVAKNLYKIV